MNTKNPIYFFCGALLGSAIGATAALMLTPESGAEIRNQLRHLVLNEKQMRKKSRNPHDLVSQKINKNPSHKTKLKKRAHKKNSS